MSAPLYGQRVEVFHIGMQDKSYAEFAREHTPGTSVVYRVGTSSAAHDWYAYQPGSFDEMPKIAQPVPFQIIFELRSTPQGTFFLQLNAIFRYRIPAAPRYVIDINGHKGSYQLAPRPAPELWWPTGGSDLQFIGYQSLEIPLPASYLRLGRNILTVSCVQGFGIYYDDLSLTNDRSVQIGTIVEASVEPTVFYTTGPGGLMERTTISVRTSRALRRAHLKLVVGAHQTETDVTQDDFGDIQATLEVPAPSSPVPIALYVSGTRCQLSNSMFQPARQWRLYAEPREQADFGFNEVPARTLEWENQYIDRFLEILHAYPSYSFTLDASANLESFLRTRDAKRGDELLTSIRTGKVGLNALSLNFFTSLASAEELFQMQDYALRTAKHFQFNLDEASQTDEPTETWALPQILSEAGIKYFANGSDPIHAPFNPIGHLNFQSPFYWEAPNGAKVLMWDAVGYTVLRDLTWEGWNSEDARLNTEMHSNDLGCWRFVTCEEVNELHYTPSLYGLEHSLPLFLSQYDRADYPFDSLLLYGLENDEYPLRHFGTADIIQQWNQQYQYPKIIPGTQRDYFHHILDNFSSHIKTYRGDGGAYWEDMAGADARIAAMNRASQMQITAAEKLESMATLLQPGLRYDDAAFSEAWNNIMLADVYVWSDGGSTLMPTSTLTQISEDTHRGWAEAAFRQTRDLLTVAMDQISQLIATRRRGMVVFNSESRARDGFVDWEMQPDETLQDPSTGVPLPCGVLKSVKRYQKVRCWAKDVPAMGYRFYPVVKGEVPRGKSRLASGPLGTIEGRYYKLQLDPQTGAVARLIDKETGQNLVRADSGYKLNEYLYVTGGDSAGDNLFSSDSQILSADPTLPLPRLTINRQSVDGTPQVARFPWGTVVTIRAHSVNTPAIVTTITLNDEQKEIAFQNEVEKTSTLRKEGVYFAFPFSIEKPEVHYQGATAWINPKTDMLPGADLQWFATQGGVRVKGANQSVGWFSVDSPLITFEDINRGRWPDSIQISNGSVFSYAMNNYWSGSTPGEQGGHFTFRYVLTSGTELSLSAMARLSTEARSPLYSIRHYQKEWKQTLPENSPGFVSALPEGLSILTMRFVSDDTYLIRLHNATDKEVTASLQFPLAHLKDAYLASPLGDRRSPVDWSEHEVKFGMAKYDIKTLAVSLKAAEN